MHAKIAWDQHKDQVGIIGKCVDKYGIGKIESGDIIEVGSHAVPEYDKKDTNDP